MECPLNCIQTFLSAYILNQPYLLNYNFYYLREILTDKFTFFSVNETIFIINCLLNHSRLISKVKGGCARGAQRETLKNHNRYRYLLTLQLAAQAIEMCYFCKRLKTRRRILPALALFIVVSTHRLL